MEGGNLVRREWWRYYDRNEVRAFGTTVISVDATFKDAEDNDFVAIEVWGKLGNNYYLRYCVNQHLNFPGTVQMIRLVKRLYPESQYILVEDKANGSAIIQTLRSEFVGVISVTPKGGKVSRVNAISPAIESGNVYVPRGELWAEELVDQFTAFPAGKHDDMVDSASQALSFMIFSNGLVSAPLTLEQRRLAEAQAREQRSFLSPEIYDVYGDGLMWPE